MKMSPVARLCMILSKKRITKALIRLRECAGWSAPVLFANPRRQVFSAQIIVDIFVSYLLVDAKFMSPIKNNGCELFDLKQQHSLNTWNVALWNLYIIILGRCYSCIFSMQLDSHLVIMSRILSWLTASHLALLTHKAPQTTISNLPLFQK